LSHDVVDRLFGGSVRVGASGAVVGFVLGVGFFVVLTLEAGKADAELLGCA